MDELGLFTAALGLSEPWRVTRTEFDPERPQLDLYLDFGRGAQFPCPAKDCAHRACPLHDTTEKTWRHLDFFQHKAFLHARQPSRVNPIAVEHLELVTQTHRSLYHDLSSVELIPAVTGHLQVTTLLLRGTQPLPLRRRLAAIAGETAGHAAWLFHDLGDQHSAVPYYSVADVATREAGDPALDAYVRGFRSLVMSSQGQAWEALGLARGAAETAHRSATATTRAWLAGLEAQALATMGDRTPCLDALRRADSALGHARREEDPAWMYEFDHARLLAVSGACYGQLGKTAAAGQILREALETLGPKRSRRRAEVLVDLARVHARQQDAEEAAGLAGEALEIAVQTGSPAGIQRVRRFRPELDRWNGTRAVSVLDEQLAHAF